MKTTNVLIPYRSEVNDSPTGLCNLFGHLRRMEENF